MRLAFHSDYLSEAEVSAAFSLLADEIDTVLPLEVVRFDDPMDDRLGFLLPAERGGGEGDQFFESLRLILVFASVSAFAVFVRGFLGRAGEIVAERLFKPSSKEYRDAALARERERRSRWEDQVAQELENMREMGGVEPTSEQIGHIRRQWREWGHESMESMEYHGAVDVTVFVEERHTVMGFELEFDGLRERIFSQAPFGVSTRRRSWERAGVELLLILESLQGDADVDAWARVEHARSERRLLRRSLEEFFQRQHGQGEEET